MRETLDILLNMPLKKGKQYSAEDVKCFAEGNPGSGEVRLDKKVYYSFN